MVLLAIIFAFFLSDTVDSDVVVLKHEVNIVVHDGKRTQERKLLIKVNNRSGDWVSKIAIPFKIKHRPKNLQARILNEQFQEIKKLKKKDLIEKSSVSSMSLYEDDMSLHFDLRHNVFPYLLEYSYSEEVNEFLSLANWYPAFRNKSTEYAALTIEVPANYGINIHERKVEPAIQKRLETGNTQYRWEIENLDRIESEYGSPAWSTLTPYVKVMPVLLDYGVKGTTNTWEEYGKWVYDLGAESNDLRPADIEILESVVTDKSSKKVIAKQLYEYLQDEMRYVYVAIGVGGMQPYPASYVMDNRYGDCKALTYFMKSALEYFDIESYPVNVYWTNNPRELLVDIPSQQFNHVFLCVPIAGDTLWLENTSKTYPFDYLDIRKQGVQGLLINKAESHLIRLPKTPIEELLSTTKVSFEIDHLDLNGTLDSDFRGYFFETLINVDHYGNRTDQTSWMKNNFLYEDSEVLGYKIIKGKRTEERVRLSVSFNLTGHIQLYGDNQVVFLPKLTLPDLEKPEERLLPLNRHIPVHQVDSIYYNLSDLALEIEIPESSSIESEMGAYSFQYKHLGNQILVRRKLIVYPNTYSVGDEYEQFYEFIKAIKREEKKAYFNFKL